MRIKLLPIAEIISLRRPTFRKKLYINLCENGFVNHGASMFLDSSADMKEKSAIWELYFSILKPYVPYTAGEIIELGGKRYRSEPLAYRFNRFCYDDLLSRNLNSEAGQFSNHISFNSSSTDAAYRKYCSLLEDVKLGKVFQLFPLSKIKLLNSAGKKAVTEYLQKVLSLHGKHSISNILPVKFVYDDVTIEGKLSKRIAKYIFQNYGVRLTDGELASLGQICSEAFHANKLSSHYAGLRDIDWNHGDYGDGGSCFWGSNSGHKDYWKKMGAKGFVLHENATLVSGIARALVIPVKRFEPMKLWFMTNVYTKSGNMKISLQNMAQIYRDVAQTHYPNKKLEIRQVNAGTHYSISIYNNGSTGFLIGEPEAISQQISSKGSVDS